MAPATVWEGELSAAERAALSPGTPDRLNRRPDVLVVGGGVIGLATAMACRRARLGSVVLVEQAERLASAASGSNGGAIAPDMHALTDAPEFVAFGRASLAMYRDLDAEWDGAIGLRTTRWLRLFPARSSPPAPPVGPQFESLEGPAIGELEPDLAAQKGSTALLVTGQGAVNPQRLAAALAVRAGTVATGVAATGIRVRGDRIMAVNTSIGDFQPGVVVTATDLFRRRGRGGSAKPWSRGTCWPSLPGRGD